MAPVLVLYSLNPSTGLLWPKFTVSKESSDLHIIVSEIGGQCCFFMVCLHWPFHSRDTSWQFIIVDWMFHILFLRVWTPTARIRFWCSWTGIITEIKVYILLSLTQNQNLTWLSSSFSTHRWHHLHPSISSNYTKPVVLTTSIKTFFIKKFKS